MTQAAAWWCPACAAYHAPHVETCPNKLAAVPYYTHPVIVPVPQPIPYNPWPTPFETPVPWWYTQPTTITYVSN